MPQVNVYESLKKKLLPLTESSELTKEDISMMRLIVKPMIEQAIEQELDLAPIEEDQVICITQNFSFKPVHDRVIRRKSKELKIRESEVLTMLLNAAEHQEFYNNHLEKSITTHSLSKYLKASKRDERIAQTKFHTFLLDSLHNNKVGFVEASTGVGKTLAMIAAANEISLKENQRTIIAVPTIAVMRQFANEYSTIKDICTPANFTLGMSSFVDIEALEALVDDEYVEHKDKVASWLSQGCPALGEWKSIASPYLLESLLSIIPELPASEIKLNPSSDPFGLSYQFYKSQFYKSDEPCAEIIITTHAMLAIDMQTRAFQENKIDGVSDVKQGLKGELDSLKKADEQDKGKFKDAFASSINSVATLTRDEDIGHLPLWHYLLVDEAHLFEENVANTLSNYISLRGLIKKLEHGVNDGTIAKNTLNLSRKAFDELTKNITSMDDVNAGNRYQSNDSVNYLIKDILAPVARMRIKPSQGDDVIRMVKEVKFALKAIETQGVKGPECIVTFSPIKKLPQLIVGYRNNDRLFAKLWSRLRGAACVSATLYTKKKDTDSALYYRMLLAAPEYKTKEYTPVIPSWVKSPINHLHIPEFKTLNGRAWLSPPSSNKKISIAEKVIHDETWHSEVAQKLFEVQDSAQGGVLTLLTSYATMANLQSRLIERQANKFPIIYSDGKSTFSQQRTAFMEEAKKGNKPIWLAVGGAWTGLDINGKDVGIDDALEDNILTDLVIPRIPFGLNKTITHEMRRRNAYYGSIYEVLDTAMRFKQGLGRLVRREGLPHNRNIWFLDSRISDPQMAGFIFSIKQLIKTYKVKTFRE